MSASLVGAPNFVDDNGFDIVQNLELNPERIVERDTNAVFPRLAEFCWVGREPSIDNSRCRCKWNSVNRRLENGVELLVGIRCPKYPILH
jgi:hypothetical protein